MRSYIILATVSICAAGCSTTSPVAVIDQHGSILRGTSTAAISGGSFEVSGGGVRCAGNYNAFDTSPTITTTALCSDGRRGIVTVNRNKSGGGSGRVRFSDGTEADFLFGDAARNI